MAYSKKKRRRSAARKSGYSGPQRTSTVRLKRRKKAVKVYYRAGYVA